MHDIHNHHDDGDLDYEAHNDRGNTKRFYDNDALRIFARNILIENDERLEILLGELEETDWDIILPNETRAADGVRILDGGHKLFTSIGITSFAGIGILVNERLRASVLGHKRVSGRMGYIDLRWNRMRIRVINVYVPHVGYDRHGEEDIMAFYEELYGILRDAARG